MRCKEEKRREGFRETLTLSLVPRKPIHPSIHRFIYRRTKRDEHSRRQRHGLGQPAEVEALLPMEQENLGEGLRRSRPREAFQGGGQLSMCRYGDKNFFRHEEKGGGASAACHEAQRR